MSSCSKRLSLIFINTLGIKFGLFTRMLYLAWKPGKWAIMNASIIFDYMNKWLPLKHNATTCDALGQAGESVHGATVYSHVIPDDVKERLASANDDEDSQKY
eukprot:gene14485-17124_t